MDILIQFQHKTTHTHSREPALCLPSIHLVSPRAAAVLLFALLQSCCSLRLLGALESSIIHSASHYSTRVYYPHFPPNMHWVVTVTSADVVAVALSAVRLTVTEEDQCGSVGENVYLLSIVILLHFFLFSLNRRLPGDFSPINRHQLITFMTAVIMPSHFKSLALGKDNWRI